MAINQRLDLKQGQTLTMTPQLQQAIKLLQMSNLELTEFVETELEKNPLLERDDSMSSERQDSMSSERGEGPTAESREDSSPEGQEDSSSESQDNAAGHDDERQETGTEREGETPEDAGYRAETAEAGAGSETAPERELDTDFDNVFTGAGMAEQEGGYDAFATSSFATAGKGGNLKFEDPDYSFENNMARETSLRDYLQEQISLEFADNTDRAIAFVLLDYLDESGYIRTDIPALAGRLGAAPERVEKVLDTLQRLDPAGIFARNLSECLSLQLREQNRLDPAMQTLLGNLELLASHDLKRLKSLCQVDETDLKEMIAEVRALNPKPALEFDHFVSQTVIPDVLMRPLPKSKGGGWAVELNNDTLPRVLVNKTYYTEISNTAKAKKDKEYLTEQLTTANWLVKALDQRAETILKTAAEIILQQEGFFLYGVEYLRPLVLKDIADVIGMHESTVSRVTTNKYIGTPRGVFELKYFFTSGLSSTDGGADFSSSAVKARLKGLIEAENPAAILSDDDLVTLLKKDGIDIARRTVAKYREAMKIPSSVQRRRQKNS